MAIFDIDAAAWQASAGAAPFTFGHNLAHDATLAHDQVVDLAGRLPLDFVETNESDMGWLYPGDEVLVIDRPAAEVARDITELRRWMALSHIEADPPYAELLQRCLEGVMASGVDWVRPFRDTEGYIFLSAPRSVTPAHLDHEFNLFLQIEGTKEAHVGWADESTETATLEGMYSGHYGRVDQLPESTEHFSLEPGDGLFIPPRAVHMLEVGDARSVSLSIVFHTPALDRAAQVYAFNAKARAVGRRPRPPGSSRATDAAKSATVSIWRAARRVSRILLRRGALPSVEAERRVGTLT